jgi:DNA-binding beta-propeller fold protein YncE
MSPDRKMNGRDIAVLDSSEFVTTPGHQVAVVRIPINKGPISGIATSHDGSRLVVTNYGGDSVSIVDVDDCRVVGTIADVDEPFAIAMGEAGTDRAYVSTVSAAYDAIQVIDLATNSIVATHPVALSVSDLSASADGKYIYASRNGVRAADVAVLDSATGRVEVVDIATTPGTTTECVRASTDGGRLYVGVNGPAGGQLVVIDTGMVPEAGAESEGRSRWRRKSPKSPAKSKANAAQQDATRNAAPKLTVIETIEIGLAVRDVAISPTGALVYVASSGPDFAVLDVVDTRTNKITSTRKIGEVNGLLTRLTLSGDGDRAYLVSHDSVTMLCTLTQDVIDSVNVATQPSCVVESRDGKYLYIADYSGAITVAPIAAGSESGFEQAALESKRSADLFVPDLLQHDLQYDPALV